MAPVMMGRQMPCRDPQKAASAPYSQASELDADEYDAEFRKEQTTIAGDSDPDWCSLHHKDKPCHKCVPQAEPRTLRELIDKSLKENPRSGLFTAQAEPKGETK